MRGLFTPEAPKWTRRVSKERVIGRIQHGEASAPSRKAARPVNSLLPRAGIAGGWIAFVLVTERWRPWDDGIRLNYATDIRDYATLARAAPGFPSTRIQAAHADRFPAPWLVGEVHRLTGIGLHSMFSIATGVVLVATVLTIHLALVALRATVGVYGLVLGALIGSAYPFRLLLDAPGMLTDAVFVLGLSFAVLAFVTGREWLVVTGVAVAELGRQNAVPLAVVAAVALLLRHRSIAATLTVVTPGCLYVATHRLSQSFSDRSGRGIVGMTVGGGWAPHAAASHLARTLVTVAIPAAFLVAGGLRSHAQPLLLPLLLGATVVAEAVVLAPDWSHAEPRLAGLALPALLIAAVPVLEGARLTTRQYTVCAFGVMFASLHHIYSNVGITRTSEWGALVLTGSLCIVGTGVFKRQEAEAHVRSE